LIDIGSRSTRPPAIRRRSLIASKADIREELDRLVAHVAQARHLIARRTGRSQARLPVAGAQPRIHTLWREIERRPSSRTLASTQDLVEQFRDRCKTWNNLNGIDRASWPDVRFVLTVRCGQDDAVPASASITTPTWKCRFRSPRVRRVPASRMAATIISSIRPASSGWRAWGTCSKSAQVFDHRYGTPRAPVEQALAQGRDVLFDIDWQGTQQLREKAASDVVSVSFCPIGRRTGAAGCIRAHRIAMT